jgi:hypothetical protein
VIEGDQATWSNKLTQPRALKSCAWCVDVQLISGVVLHRTKIEMTPAKAKPWFRPALVPERCLSAACTGDGERLPGQSATQMERAAVCSKFHSIWTAISTSPTRRSAAPPEPTSPGTNSEFGFDYLRDNMADPS